MAAFLLCIINSSSHVTFPNLTVATWQMTFDDGRAWRDAKSWIFLRSLQNYYYFESILPKLMDLKPYLSYKLIKLITGFQHPILSLIENPLWGAWCKTFNYNHRQVLMYKELWQPKFGHKLDERIEILEIENYK